MVKVGNIEYATDYVEQCGDHVMFVASGSMDVEGTLHIAPIATLALTHDGKVGRINGFMVTDTICSVVMTIMRRR